MAADRSQNLQDTFLNHVRKGKVPLTIFLVNGVKLQRGMATISGAFALTPAMAPVLRSTCGSK